MRMLDAHLAAGEKINAAAFARQHKVSARTVYRHQARVREEGEWRPRSRRPHHSPQATPPELEALICKLRADLVPDNGADYIRDALVRICARTGPAWSVPSRSTINRVLDRRDVLVRNPAKRPRSSWRRFCFARPRDCFQIDATEVAWPGLRAVVFEVLDDCTRTLVANYAAPGETADAAIAAILAAIEEYGTPALVLSDNGSAFTGGFARPDIVGSFARTLLRRGVRPITSSPYHPQTCGKVERHHQTFKKWLATQPPPETLDELQLLLKIYRRYYNTERAHSALPRRCTPQQAWQAAPSLGGPASTPIQTDATLHHCKVAPNGSITVGLGQRTNIGKTWAGVDITTIRDGDHITIYSPDGQPIAYTDLDPTRAYTRIAELHMIIYPGSEPDTSTGTSP
jgi:transposase InsO family protein